MLRGLKKSITRTATAAFDRWIARLSPGERIYVLDEISRGVTKRLIQAEEAGLRPGTPRARLRVLKEHLAKELESLSRADKVDFFRATAMLVGVDSYGVSGPLGIFHGHSQDGVVLARYAAHGTWDPAYQTLLRNHLFRENRGTLIDIGANIGLTSIPIARERRISCYAFEPEPGNYLNLRENVLANDVESLVNCSNLALFSEEGFLTLALASRNLGDHRVQSEKFKSKTVPLSSEHEEQRQAIQVRATTLDAFFRGKSLSSPHCDEERHTGKRGPRPDWWFGTIIACRLPCHRIRAVSPERIGDSADAYIALIGQFPYGAFRKTPMTCRENCPTFPRVSNRSKF